MLNERLKNLRLAKGLTLKQVGEEFGISAASVASWENGKNQPDSRKLSKIAAVLGTSVEFLLNGSSDSELLETESIHIDVPFVSWLNLENFDSKKSVDRTTPLLTAPSFSSFATRYPGSVDLNWNQGPIPAGAIIFIDPEKALQSDSVAIVSYGKNKIDLARVQMPAKPSGHYLKLISSGDSVHSVKDVKVIGTVVEWRISGKL
jgi:transcriptional regulator with XRE-family HTH domain